MRRQVTEEQLLHCIVCMSTWTKHCKMFDTTQKFHTSSLFEDECLVSLIITLFHSFILFTMLDLECICFCFVEL